MNFYYKSAIIWISCKKTIIYLSLASFKIFFFLWLFISLIMMFLGLNFFQFILFGVYWSFESLYFWFSTYLENYQLLVLQFFFFPYYSFFSLYETPITWMLGLLVFPDALGFVLFPLFLRLHNFSWFILKFTDYLFHLQTTIESLQWRFLFFYLLI